MFAAVVKIGNEHETQLMYMGVHFYVETAEAFDSSLNVFLKI